MMNTMKSSLAWICILLALAGAGFAGWVDFHNDEPQAAVLVILIVTFLLGAILPSKAWLWAIIVALGVPGMYLLLRSLGYQPTSPPSPRWYASLLALIPGFIGAYAGALGRVIMKNILVSSNSHN